METLLVGLLMVLLVMNTLVTRSVLGAEFLEQQQKLRQVAIVWLIPIFGAIVIFVFLRANRERAEPESKHIRNEDDHSGTFMQSPHGPSDP